MEMYINNELTINQSEKINSLINDIFQLSCSYTKSHAIKMRSCDKFEKDIFSLDCARHQLEIILIRSGISVEKCYDYKYHATEPNDDEYRSFSYSFNALVTLWKNFSYNYNFEISQFNRVFFEESIETFIDELKNTKRILEENFMKLKNYSYVLENGNIAL